MSYIANNLAPHSHCFFGSVGGVSLAPYASLNTSFSSLDDKENVEQNILTIAKHFGLTKQNLVIQNQSIYSPVVNYTNKPSFFELTGDGLVSDKPDTILCVRTADCAPVLFADYETGIIGACHAGWRNALNGVVENTINLMLSKGAKLENIRAAIGPCLQRPSFNAKEDMLKTFINVNDQYEEYFHPHNTDYKFDLERFVFDKLQNLRLNNITRSGIDTYTDEDYFSSRRSTHQGTVKQTNDFPTQLSCIKL